MIKTIFIILGILIYTYIKYQIFLYILAFLCLIKEIKE